MRKTLLTLACLGFIAAPALADDTLIIDDGAESIVTGIVTDIDGDEIIMMVGTKEIEVDIDQLKIDDNAEDYFPVGTKIQVVGTLDDDDEMNASKIIRVDGVNSDINLTTDID